MNERLEQTENLDFDTEEVYEQVPSQNSYRIFHYFKNNPSVFIAIISGTIAMMAFLINCLSFVLKTRSLRAWNIDPSLVPVDNRNMFYNLCYSVLMAALLLIVYGLVNPIYHSYAPYQRCKVALDKYKKNNQRTLKNIQRQLDSLTKAQHHTPQMKSQIISLQKLSKKINTTEPVILSQFNKKFRTFRRVNAISLLLIFITLYLLMTVYIGFCQHVPSGFGYHIIIFLETLTIFFVLLSGAILARHVAFKQDKRLNGKKKTIEQLMSQVEMPFQKYANHNLKDLFTDKFLIKLFSNVWLLFFISFLCIALFPNSNKRNKEYKVLNINETSYVSIYADSERMILEEVEIDNGTATINTAKQKIISVTDYPFDVVLFNKVIIIP